MRRRDYEVVYSRKVVGNFTRGVTPKNDRAERDWGINRRKINVLQHSGDRNLYRRSFPFFLLPSLDAKRCDIDRTRASRRQWACENCAVSLTADFRGQLHATWNLNVPRGACDCVSIAL